METPIDKYHSYVYIYAPSEDERLVLHVVDHDALLPRETLKVLSYVAAAIVKESLPDDAPATCVTVLHYLPAHRIIDLTLLDTHGAEASAALTLNQARASNEGIQPFLVLARDATSSSAPSSMIEMYYDDVNNLLTETFHYVPRAEAFRRPELDAFVDFIRRSCSCSKCQSVSARG